MKILGDRILVSRVEEVKKEGFETVEVQDSFIYKGKIESIGNATPYRQIAVSSTSSNNAADFDIGDIVIFAKYSPDTQEVEIEGQKMKIIRTEDVLAVL